MTSKHTTLKKHIQKQLEIEKLGKLKIWGKIKIDSKLKSMIRSNCDLLWYPLVYTLLKKGKKMTLEI